MSQVSFVAVAGIVQTSHPRRGCLPQRRRRRRRRRRSPTHTRRARQTLPVTAVAHHRCRRLLQPEPRRAAEKQRRRRRRPPPPPAPLRRLRRVDQRLRAVASDGVRVRRARVLPQRAEARRHGAQVPQLRQHALRALRRRRRRLQRRGAPPQRRGAQRLTARGAHHERAGGEARVAAAAAGARLLDAQHGEGRDKHLALVRVLRDVLQRDAVRHPAQQKEDASALVVAVARGGVGGVAVDVADGHGRVHRTRRRGGPRHEAAAPERGVAPQHHRGQPGQTPRQPPRAQPRARRRERRQQHDVVRPPVQRVPRRARRRCTPSHALRGRGRRRRRRRRRKGARCDAEGPVDRGEEGGVPRGRLVRTVRLPRGFVRVVVGNVGEAQKRVDVRACQRVHVQHEKRHGGHAWVPLRLRLPKVPRRQAQHVQVVPLLLRRRREVR
eukprot:Rhum_TRINITY_DN3100_c0_g1::Rhum_TRINITY_DN3100_c0_g1_i1::g.9596::m.9596